jgi:hypothetical protein
MVVICYALVVMLQSLIEEHQQYREIDPSMLDIDLDLDLPGGPL